MIFDGCKIVASISGGKDSTALCLHLKEKGIKYHAVHMDTGWEHPTTDEYIRDVLEKAIGPITWIPRKYTFKELCIHKRMFPSRIIRFCTSELKVLPFQRYIWDSL
jgi:3'-phosphoadenosine 5'-phosphosulfate sulfotransferase (PAPS reductase)/FAD synthetase